MFDPYQRVRFGRSQKSYRTLEYLRRWLFARVVGFGLLGFASGVALSVRAVSQTAENSHPLATLLQQNTTQLLWQALFGSFLVAACTFGVWWALGKARHHRRWWLITLLLLLLGLPLFALLTVEGHWLQSPEGKAFVDALGIFPDPFPTLLLTLVLAILALQAFELSLIAASLGAQLQLSRRPVKGAKGLYIDVPSLAELPILGAYHRGMTRGEKLPWRRSSAAFQLLTERGCLRLALINGMFAGFTLVDPRSGVLHTVTIHGDFIDRGVYTALLDDYVTGRRGRRAIMEVPAANSGLQTILQEQGWVKRGPGAVPAVLLYEFVKAAA
jgi:hypothetical protein